MIEPFVLVYQSLLGILKPDAMPNVLSILIVQPIKHASMHTVKIHAKHQHAALMLNVVFMIIPLIVIAVMVLWAMHSFIVYRYLRLEIKQPIHALNHRVCPEVFVMCTEMLLFVIHVQTKMATIIQAVGQSVCQTVIVNSIKRV